MVNFKVRNQNLLIQKENLEEQKTLGGIIIPPTNEQNVVSGKIIKVDLDSYYEVDNFAYFRKNDADEIVIDGKTYFIVKEENILGIKN